MKRLSEGLIPKIIEILRKTGSSTNDLIHNQQLIKNLIDYLDTNLIFLKANLVGENFERVLSVVWSATSSAISDIITEGINNKMSAPYFTNLTQTFRILLNFFFGENIPQNDLVIDGISHTLKLYSYNIGDLILTYYDRRYLDQRLLSATSTYPIGSITLRALIDRSHLRIEILNSRHLKPSHIQRRQYGEDIVGSTFDDSRFSRNHNHRRSYAFGASSSSVRLSSRDVDFTCDENDGEKRLTKMTYNEYIQDIRIKNARNNHILSGNGFKLSKEDKCLFLLF